MVRINLIDPRKLADQHLIAEYNEILMLVGHLKKHGVKKNKIPANYCLGKGHINFFKNKLNYLKKRHSLISDEMRRREFCVNKKIMIGSFKKELKQDWTPSSKDFKIIKKRIIEKIRQKPSFYRYEGENLSVSSLIKIVRNAK